MSDLTPAFTAFLGASPTLLIAYAVEARRPPVGTRSEQSRLPHLRVRTAGLLAGFITTLICVSSVVMSGFTDGGLDSDGWAVAAASCGGLVTIQTLALFLLLMDAVRIGTMSGRTR